MLDITKDIQSLTTFRRSSGDFMKCKIITKRARQRMLPSFPEKKRTGLGSHPEEAKTKARCGRSVSSASDFRCQVQRLGLRIQLQCKRRWPRLLHRSRDFWAFFQGGMSGALNLDIIYRRTGTARGA